MSCACPSILDAAAGVCVCVHVLRRYTPRDELCMSIMGQIRRQMHTMNGAQLSTVIRAIAIAPR